MPSRFNVWLLRHKFGACAVLLVVMVFAIYLPGLPGGFEFDDTPNLTENYRFTLSDHSLKSLVGATFSSLSGPTGRPVSMFSFVLNQMIWGLQDPLPYKLSNIAIHAANAVLFLIFAFLLLRARASHIGQFGQASASSAGNDPRSLALVTSAVIAAAFWAVHPLQLTSVLYIVQRMTMLAASFTLLSLICYVIARQRMLAGRPRRAWLTPFGAAALCGLLAVFAKENALLFPLFWLLTEIFGFGCRGFTQVGDTPKLRLQERLPWLGTQPLNLGLLALYAGGLLLALIGVVLTLVVDPQFVLAGYNGRHFDWHERLLTETRVLWFYLYLLVLPSTANMGLYHDDIVVSSSLLDPISTLVATLGWLAVVVCLPVLWRRRPLLGFGLSWYLCGHLLESTLWPLEIAHEHRNYLPVVGFMIALGSWLGTALARLEARRKLYYAMLGASLLILSLSTLQRAIDWSDLNRHSFMEAVNHPDSPRARYDAARAYLTTYRLTKKNKYYQDTMEHLRASARLGEHTANEIAFLGLMLVPFYSGAYPDPKDLDDYAKRLQSSPAYALNAYHLEFLLRCQSQGSCKLKDEAIFKLYDALFANPRLDDETAARLHKGRASYYANNVRDLFKAGQEYYRAVQRMPTDIDNRLAYIEYLTAIGLYDEAQKQWKKADELSHSWKYQAQLAQTKKTLEKTRRARPPATDKPAADLQPPASLAPNAPVNQS